MSGLNTCFCLLQRNVVLKTLTNNALDTLSLINNLLIIILRRDFTGFLKMFKKEKDVKKQIIINGGNLNEWMSKPTG